jgi:HAMP domain-containing protein
MDCKTARGLLDFARRRPPELDAADAAALEDHLFQCHPCAALAAAQRRFDEPLGRAMRRVEVPPGLKTMILDRLDAARADCSRRRTKRWARALAAAAAILIAVGGVWYWQSVVSRPSINLEDLRESVQQQAVISRTRDDVTAEIKAKFGVATVLPDDLNYNLLTHTALDKFDGKWVPLLIFNRNDQARAHAAVYVLSDGQFNLQGLTGHDPSPAGYSNKVDVLLHPNGRYAYVIIYTGDDWRWLRTELQSL